MARNPLRRSAGCLVSFQRRRPGPELQLVRILALPFVIVGDARSLLSLSARCVAWLNVIISRSANCTPESPRNGGNFVMRDARGQVRWFLEMEESLYRNGVLLRDNQGWQAQAASLGLHWLGPACFRDAT